MGRRAIAGGIAVVEQICRDLQRRRGQVDQTCRREGVVRRRIPFIAKQAIHQRSCAAGLRLRCNRRIGPESQLRFVIGDRDRADTGRNRPGRPGRSAGLSACPPAHRSKSHWPAEPRIHERAGRRAGRVDQGVGVGVLVGDQGAVGVSGGVDTRRKLRLPEDLVAAQEHQVDARLPGGEDILILLIGPIFVVTDVHIDLVIEQQSVVGCGGDLFA